jgi:hypothetical protein
MTSLSRPISKLSKLFFLALFLTLTTAALGKTTWYVDGVSGSDANDCKSQSAACATIGHAMSLARPGDTIMVGAATYTENLSINKNLEIIGADASTTIIDGGGVSTVVTINSANTGLSKMTIRNGRSDYGGGIVTSYSATQVTIANCIITANSATYQGGGIMNWVSTVTVNNSTISANTLS